jgi:hypothetical protein
MTWSWWDILVSLFFFVLLYVSFQLGAATEHWKQESREEAIRLEAYKNGRNSVIDEHNERLSMMAPELWAAYHIVKWNPPITNDTKESS